MRTSVYLDNNATTPLDPQVFEAMRTSLESQFGNPASSTHAYGWYAEELVRQARERTAALLNAEPEEIVFTSGATESNNLALKGAAEAAGTGHLLSAATEHKAVLDPLERLEHRGFSTTLLGVDELGMLDPAALQEALRPDTRLVSIMLANNEIGVIHDIQEIARICRKHGALLHCDATQAVGKIEVDVRRLGADLLSLSAHKMYGPKGAGALYIRRQSPPLPLVPQIDGGGHESGYRSGTLNVPGIVGLGAACSIAAEHRERDAAHMRSLAGLLLQELRRRLDGIHLNGHSERRIPGNLSLRFDGVNNARLVGKINTKLALSVSSACQSASSVPSHVLAALGLDARQQQEVVRIGIGRFSTEKEIQIAAEVLSRAIAEIRG